MNKKYVFGFKGKYSFLSSISPATVVYGGLVFKCAESAYHSAKTRDKFIKKEFTELNGYEAKELSKKLIMRSDWHKIKDGVMEEIVRDKFTRNKRHQKRLLETGDAKLIELNDWNDTYWGCMQRKGRK